MHHRPGSKNVKPDTESDPGPPAPILPATCFVGVITCEVEKVEESIQGVEILPWTPTNESFVPKQLRGLVIHWAYISLISCHPGVRRTMLRIQECFCLPFMRKEVVEYVVPCSWCPLQDLQQIFSRPLPVPQCPWSYILLDSVSGLPISEGNMVVVTVVVRVFIKYKIYPTS